MELEESTCLTSGSTTKPQPSRQLGFVCTSVQEYSRLFIGQEIEVANVPPIDVGSVSSQNILDTLAASE